MDDISVRFVDNTCVDCYGADLSDGDTFHDVYPSGTPQFIRMVDTRSFACHLTDNRLP